MPIIKHIRGEKLYSNICLPKLDLRKKENKNNFWFKQFLVMKKFC